MTEKISNLLFHPSTLGQYRKINLFKALSFLFLLSIIAVLVPIIDTIQSPGLSRADREVAEFTSGFTFDADTLPNCFVDNNQYICSDEASQNVSIGTIFPLIGVKIVSDVNDTKEISGFYTLRLTKNEIKFEFNNMLIHSASYDELPSNWQSFNFIEIKDQDNPDDAFYRYFIGGYNQLVERYTPMIIIQKIIQSFLGLLIQVLFFSILFYLFFKRYHFHFGEIFRITIFAETFAIVLGLIFDLIDFYFYTSFFVVIYTYIALLANISQKKEF